MLLIPKLPVRQQNKVTANKPIKYSICIKAKERKKERKQEEKW